MKLVARILSGILFLFMLSNGHVQAANGDEEEPCCVMIEAGVGDVWEFRETYIPKEFHPLPEYMVFVDMGMLFLVMLIGLFYVVKKKPARHLSLLAILVLVYLGLIRGGCICPVGLTSNMAMGIVNPAMIGLAAMLIFLVPLVIALIAGRVFCTAGCPLGAVQHLFYKKKKHYKLPAKLNTFVKVVPVIILVATVYLAIQGSRFFICELDPYKAAFFTGQAWFEQGLAFVAGRPMEPRLLWVLGISGWIYFIAVMVIGYWVPRPFCRLLCPYGVLLGVVSTVSFRRRRIADTDCTFCGRCEKVCPTQAIAIEAKSRKASLSNYDCIQCNKCTDSCKTMALNV